jgi:hypothetical protein
MFSGILLTFTGLLLISPTKMFGEQSLLALP